MSAEPRTDNPGERRRRPVGYFDLLRDLPREGCAVCRGETRSAWRYIDGLLWEGVTDGGVRETTRGAHGFCRDHSLMAVSVASAESGQLGMAILFEDLLRHVEEEARRAPSDRGRGRRRVPRPDQDGLAPHGRCRACVSAGATAANYLAVLADEGPASEIGSASTQGRPALCFHHLRLESGPSLPTSSAGVSSRCSSKARASSVRSFWDSPRCRAADGVRPRTARSCLGARSS